MMNFGCLLYCLFFFYGISNNNNRWKEKKNYDILPLSGSLPNKLNCFICKVFFFPLVNELTQLQSIQFNSTCRIISFFFYYWLKWVICDQTPIEYLCVVCRIKLKKKKKSFMAFNYSIIFYFWKKQHAKIVWQRICLRSIFKKKKYCIGVNYEAGLKKKRTFQNRRKKIIKLISFDQIVILWTAPTCLYE